MTRTSSTACTTSRLAQAGEVMAIRRPDGVAARCPHPPPRCTSGAFMDIPDDFHPLLRSTAVAVVSTLGPNGEPQATPTWFMFDGDRLSFTLVDGRQRLRNLRRDPRASVVVIDPAQPTFYLQLRGRVALVTDPEAAL